MFLQVSFHQCVCVRWQTSEKPASEGETRNNTQTIYQGLGSRSPNYITPILLHIAHTHTYVKITYKIRKSHDSREGGSQSFKVNTKKLTNYFKKNEFPLYKLCT